MKIVILVYGRHIVEEDGLNGGTFLACVLYQFQLGKSLNASFFDYQKANQKFVVLYHEVILLRRSLSLKFICGASVAEWLESLT